MWLYHDDESRLPGRGEGPRRQLGAAGRRDRALPGGGALPAPGRLRPRGAGLRHRRGRRDAVLRDDLRRPRHRRGPDRAGLPGARARPGRGPDGAGGRRRRGACTAPA
ncbi:hypothetical protein G5V59_18450 [Nocardioides sp. W3-2-3]|nr:hypothetical protein [Nocardioides convexus]